MKRLLILLYLLLAAIGLRAQSTQTGTTTFWLNPQLGTGTYELTFAADAGVLIKDKHMLTLKLAINANVGEYKNGWREANLAGALFGTKLTHGKAVYITAAAGLAAVQFETRGDAINVQGNNYYGPSKTFVKPGIPVEVKLWANPLRFIGFTLGAGATFTPKQTFAQVTLGIAFGKLR